MEAENLSPTAAEAFRLRSNENWLLTLGGFSVPTGTTMALIVPLVLTDPSGAGNQPCTDSPVDVRRFPDLSTCRLPPRVYIVAPP